MILSPGAEAYFCGLINGCLTERDLARVERLAEIRSELCTVANLVTLAERLDVSLTTLQNWRRQGMPGIDGAWDIVEINNWREQRPDERGKTPKMLELELNNLRLDVEMKEVALQKNRSGFVSIAAAEAVCEEIRLKVEACISSLPDELASVVPESFRADAVYEIRQQVQLILRKMNLRFEQLFSAESIQKMGGSAPVETRTNFKPKIPDEPPLGAFMTNKPDAE
jgi:hypothetical protein